ncbi:MAG: integrase domain-containing protein [Gammaproteobacteria bacterium]|nr:integrase domain-containing protein [Gammaproteobacteria bacterium]MDH3374402.1 integrase domain-containing protein [Gammaproteobacteria bacterium]MDH3408119.1 integrase domain-containing protein [Gammaproteobacteria bacterium]MDH3552726.1 integrase domain-containing protein [Gammaproteobacteria bacterium]
MKDLNYQLMRLCRENRDGSYSTQATRRRILDLIANQLHELGYRRMQAKSLKPKHVDALVSHWKDQGIGVGTFKNRLSALRWWAKKVGKADMIPGDNSAFDIGNRSYVSQTSKAQYLDEKTLASVSDPYVRLSLRLQADLGLRREESIKFSPNYAIQDDHIKLKCSWTKGGRARTVPIRTARQRRLLEEVRKLARGGALIPPRSNYEKQLHRYERQVRDAGLKNPHGLRHAYAQRRYEDVTGWKAPVVGGPASKSRGSEQRALDKGARETISRELGHGRQSVSGAYLRR